VLQVTLQGSESSTTDSIDREAEHFIQHNNMSTLVSRRLDLRFSNSLK